MYIKSHEDWLLSKKDLDNKKDPPKKYRAGEIRWAAIGVNIGSEIDGKGEQFLRPVLILDKVSPDLYFCIPLSTKLKESLGYIKLKLENKIVSACLHQVKTISDRRIFSRIEKINDNKLKNIKEDLKKYLHL